MKSFDRQGNWLFSSKSYLTFLVLISQELSTITTALVNFGAVNLSLMTLECSSVTLLMSVRH